MPESRRGPSPWRFGTRAGAEAPPPWPAGRAGAELAPSCCSHRKGGSGEHASSSVPSWEPAREEGGFVFLLPSLPFGSASGGKTQPLLHPSPPDQDERGVLMQSSWTALPRSREHRSSPDHQHTGTAGRRLRPPAPPITRGGSPGPAGPWEAGAAPGPLPRPDPLPLCLRPSGVPDAAGGWAAPGLCSSHPCPLQEGMGGLVGGPGLPLLSSFGFRCGRAPPEPGLCACSGAVCTLCACWKNPGERWGEAPAPQPHRLQQVKGLQVCPHQAGAVACSAQPNARVLPGSRLLVNKCTGLPAACAWPAPPGPLPRPLFPPVWAMQPQSEGCR